MTLRTALTGYPAVGLAHVGFDATTERQPARAGVVATKRSFVANLTTSARKSVRTQTVLAVVLIKAVAMSGAWLAVLAASSRKLRTKIWRWHIWGCHLLRNIGTRILAAIWFVPTAGSGSVSTANQQHTGQNRQTHLVSLLLRDTQRQWDVKYLESLTLY